MSLGTTLLFLPGLIVGITTHECAHAWSASLLGDRFARRQGRVSLNPLRHLSPLGTLAMFLLPFGWGRPVMVNLYNFRNPKRDYLLSSLAGPAANMLVLALCLALMQFTRHSFAFGPRGELPMLITHSLLLWIALTNTILAAFNLLPIPPLDGSKIWPYIVPRLKPSYKPSTNWFYLVLLFVLLGTNALSPALGVVVRTVVTATPASDAQVASDRVEAAQAAEEAGRYADAETLFSEAIAIRPYSAELFYRRSLSKAARRNWKGAEEDIRRAAELDPRNPDYRQAEKAIRDRAIPPR